MLTAREFMEEYTVIELFISTDAEIRLPPAGVQLNADFGFASTAQNGPLPIDPPTLFESVAPIGSFLETCQFPCLLLRDRRNRRKFSQCAPFAAVTDKWEICWYCPAQLFFATPRAESVSALRLLFVPTFTIKPGETVTLILPPDFQGK